MPEVERNMATLKVGYFMKKSLRVLMSRAANDVSINYTLKLFQRNDVAIKKIGTGNT